MTWQIEFDPSALKELNKLDKPVAVRILKFLKERIATSDDPISIGEALKGSKLGEYWKYRVDSYRLICEITDNKMTVFIIKIGDKKEVYTH